MLKITTVDGSLMWPRPFMQRLVGGAKGEGGRGSGDSEQASVSQRNVIILMYYVIFFVCNLVCEKSIHVGSHGYVQGTALHCLPQSLVKE